MTSLVTQNCVMLLRSSERLFSHFGHISFRILSNIWNVHRDRQTESNFHCNMTKESQGRKFPSHSGRQQQMEWINPIRSFILPVSSPQRWVCNNPCTEVTRWGQWLFGRTNEWTGNWKLRTDQTEFRLSAWSSLMFIVNTLYQHKYSWEIELIKFEPPQCVIFAPEEIAWDQRNIFVGKSSYKWWIAPK